MPAAPRAARSRSRPSRPRAAAGAGRAPLLPCGAAFAGARCSGRRSRAGAARHGPWRHVNLIEDLFARNESLGFLGLAFAWSRRWRYGRDRARGVRAGAACSHRETASARRRGAAQRRPRREPDHRRTISQARAPEPATGARPRVAAKPCRRHHRRRRHDQAGGARIDGAARPGGAAAGVFSRAAGLDRDRGQPARADRRAVRVRGVAAA